MMLSLAKIGAIASAKYTAIMAVGQLTTWVFLAISFVGLVGAEATAGGHAAAHTGSALALVGIALEWFFRAPWDTTVFLVNLFFFLPLYLYLATSLSTQTVIKRLWDGHLQEFVANKINGYIEQSPHLEASSNVKKRLITLTKTDADNTSWKKRVLVYFIKKLPLGEINWDQDKAGISQEINTLISESMDELVEVNNYYFYMAWIAQMALSIYGISS